MAVPFAGREVGPVASLEYSAYGVFQPWRLRLQFVEPRERGVEVGFVEDLTAANHVAVDGRNVDRPPLGVKARLRRPTRNVGETTPTSLRRCTASM